MGLVVLRTVDYLRQSFRHIKISAEIGIEVNLSRSGILAGLVLKFKIKCCQNMKIILPYIVQAIFICIYYKYW